MDLHQLRTFVAIAEEGNLTRASEHLFMSQPAASAHIRLLESDLKIKLFLRTPRGMELTPAGKVLLKQAKITLEAASQLQIQAKLFHEPSYEHQLRVGIACLPSILRLEDLLTRLAEDLPNLGVSIEQNSSEGIVKKIRAGILDAAFVIGPVEDSSLICQVLSPLSLRIAAPPVLRDKIIGASLKQIADLPWISTSEKPFPHKISNRQFDSYEVAPGEALQAAQEEAQIPLASSDLGLTLLSEEVARAAESTGQVVLWDGPVDQAVISIVFPKKNEQEPILGAFLQAVYQVWNRVSSLSPEE